MNRLQNQQPNLSPPQTVTLPEAARRLSVCVMTIRRLLARDELGRVTLGRSVRVVVASIDRLIAKGGASRAK